jgi:hypothetical protein
MSQISWRHDGRRILLPVIVLKADDPFDMTHVAAQALVDTGATASGIDEKLAAQLGLRTSGKRPLHSAQGQGHAERYVFRIGIFPDDHDPATNLPYVFQDIYGFGLKGSEYFDVLIGMDILRQCDFSMTRDGLCRIIFR